MSCAAARSGARGCSRRSRCAIIAAAPCRARRRLAGSTSQAVRSRQVCAYCVGRFHIDDLTREHIVPTSRGGDDSWMNCITACRSCNGHKGNRLPEEAQHYLPYVPSLHGDDVCAAGASSPTRWSSCSPACARAACTAEAAIRHGAGRRSRFFAGLPDRRNNAAAAMVNWRSRHGVGHGSMAQGEGLEELPGIAVALTLTACATSNPMSSRCGAQRMSHVYDAPCCRCADHDRWQPGGLGAGAARSPAASPARTSAAATAQ